MRFILFLGNSLTFVNNLPKLVQNLGGGSIQISFYGYGGATFQSLYKNLPSFHNNIDTLVLQEQSMFLSQPPFIYKQNSIPWAIKLAQAIPAKRIILFETWAYRDGNPSFLTGINDTYAKMQARIKSGYEETRRALHHENTTIAYVGESWKPSYYQQDGIHPNMKGSKAAAKIIYKRILENIG